MDAYARRAAWSLLPRPRVTPTETFATAHGVGRRRRGNARVRVARGGVQSGGRVATCRGRGRRGASRDETTAAEAFAGEDAACRAAMTCAAADALSRAKAASASSESSPSSARVRGSLRGTRGPQQRRSRRRSRQRLVDGPNARCARLSPGEARAGAFDARRRRTPRQVRPALRKIRSGLATDVADVVHGDGSGLSARRGARKNRSTPSITAAVPAYLRVAGDGDAAGAVVRRALALDLDRALVAVRDAARADASRLSAAAAATARLDVIAAHPSTEFAWSAASKAASKLDVDAGVWPAKPIDVGPPPRWRHFATGTPPRLSTPF